jgi:tetratricopeptide (TPR) repeat protein
MRSQRIHLILFSFVLILLIFFAACTKENKSFIPEDKKLTLANAFYNNELYEAAIHEYEEYLADYPVDDNKRANTYYIIANIYFERLYDYDKALEYYFRIKYLYPESKLQVESGKKIVNCLERLNRAQDAQRTLEKETALKPEEIKESRPGEIIATIGKEKVTQGDLDFEIDRLPPYMQGMFNNREKKLEFLQQFILERLLYDSAKRKGLDKDKEIIEGTFRAKRQLMAQKVLTEEIQKRVDIKEADVELYYKANMDKYTEKDDKGKVIKQKSLQEVAQQVAQDLIRERQEKAYKELLYQLMKAENVEIYEKKIQ